MLFLLAATQLQALQLQPLEGTPGILPVKTGTAVISSDKWTILKQLDLNLIFEDITVNAIRFNDLNNIVDTNYNETYIRIVYSNFRLQVEYIMNLTIKKCRQLAPSYRVKRGIINPLGSIIKIITGNLDIEDAHRYDELIEHVQMKQKKIFQKVTLVSEVINGLYNVTNSLNNNMLQLDNNLKIIQNDLSNAVRLENIHYSSNVIINVYSAILHNFQITCMKLNEIETAIAFSKLNTLHQSIIDSNNLLLILKSIEKTERLVSPASLENLVRIEQSIGIKSYSKENQLIFVMEIPLIGKETYIYYKLYPLPVIHDLKTFIILPKYPYLIVNGLTSKPLAQPCQLTGDSGYICFEDTTTQFIEDDCISSLIKFSENSSCALIPVTCDNVLVQRIQPNRWIVFSKENTLIQNICSNEVLQENIQGTYIVTIQDSCEVKVDKFSLKMQLHQKEVFNYTKLPILNLPHISKIKKNEESKPVVLENIDMENIKSMVNAVKLSASEKDISEVKIYSVSVWTITLYLIIAVCGMIMLYFKLIKLGYRCNFRYSPNSPNSDNVESQGEEVMRPESGPTMFRVRL